MKPIVYFLIFTLLASLVACSDKDTLQDEPQTDPIENPDNQDNVDDEQGEQQQDPEPEVKPEYVETSYPEMTPAQVNEVAAKFAVDFFLAASQNTKGNFVYSPVNQFGALALLANGAREWTRDEILKAMSFEGVNLEDVNKYYAAYYPRLTAVSIEQNNFASGFGISSTANLAEDYLSSVNQIYNPGFIDKNNPNYINNLNKWIGDATYGYVKDAVSATSGDFDVTSVSNFENPWEIGYNESDFTTGSFNNIDGTQSEVTFMNHLLSFYVTQLQGGIMVKINTCVRTLPFNTRYTFFLLLPDVGTDLNTFIANNREAIQNPASLGTITYVAISLPQFEINSRISTKEALGEILPFTEKADFSGMMQENIALNDITQICNLKIDDKGMSTYWVMHTTEIWVGGTPSHKLVDPTPVKVDHPFAFFITEENSNLYVYFGKVEKL